MFKVTDTIIKTAYGEFVFYCFSWGQHEEDNILCASTLRASERAPLVRIQSACYTAEIFRSLDCDCHAQLDTSLARIQAEGGLLIYMLCDGRGAGLLKKVEGLELGRSKGLDTSAAYAAMGLPQDPREYNRVVEILRHFRLLQVRLLTNNPRKVEGLTRHGIAVTREPLEIKATAHSSPYLRTKALKMGHLLTQFSEHQIDEQPQSPS